MSDFFPRRLLEDNIQRWSCNISDQNSSSEEENEEEEEEEEEEDCQTKNSPQYNEELANSIFEKLGQAQPIPPSEIPDFEAR